MERGRRGWPPEVDKVVVDQAPGRPLAGATLTVLRLGGPALLVPDTHGYVDPTPSTGLLSPHPSLCQVSEPSTAECSTVDFNVISDV
jgi:hypothetical protein